MISLVALSSLPCARLAPFADIDQNGFALQFIPIVGMGFILGIIAIGTYEKAQKRRLHHETLLLALEKGQPLPPELLEEGIGRRPRNDRRAGMISIAVGIGLFIFFQAMAEGEKGFPAGMRWVGLIPVLIGVAQLVNWLLDRSRESGQDRR